MNEELIGLVDPLIKMATISDTALMPYRSTTLELVYGNMEYVRSVFGPVEVTRQMLADYYDNARINWTQFDFPKGYHRSEITNWCRTVGIRPLHYYAPMDCRSIWFRDQEDAFVFKLKFG